MTAYQNCKVGDVRQVKMESGEAGVVLRRGTTPIRHGPASQRWSKRPLRLCRRVRRIALRGVPPAPPCVWRQRKERAAKARRGIGGMLRARPHATRIMRENTPSSIFAAAHPDMKDGTRPAPAFSRQKPANTRHSRE
jgi:hypothetical protein